MQIEKDHFKRKDGKPVRRKKEKPTPSCFVRSRRSKRIDGEIAGIAHRRAGIAQWQQKMGTPEGLAEVLMAYLQYGWEFVESSTYYSVLTSEKEMKERAPEAHRKEALNAALKLFGELKKKHPDIEIPDPPNESDNPLADMRAVATWAMKVAAVCKPKTPAADTPGKVTETTTTPEKGPKWIEIRKWAEDLIKRDPTKVPLGFNELLRMAREKFRTCGVPTLRKAIEKSPTLQDWEKKTKEWAANERLAKAQPDSLEAKMQPAPDKGGHSYALPDHKTRSPEDEADDNDRMEKLCSLDIKKLEEKVKGTFFHCIKWTDDVNGGKRRNPDAEWKKLQQDPGFDPSSKESLARLYINLAEQIAENLRHDPTAQSDPIKSKYLRESGL